MYSPGFLEGHPWLLRVLFLKFVFRCSAILWLIEQNDFFSFCSILLISIDKADVAKKNQKS